MLLVVQLLGLYCGLVLSAAVMSNSVIPPARVQATNQQATNNSSENNPVVKRLQEVRQIAFLFFNLTLISSVREQNKKQNKKQMIDRVLNKCRYSDCRIVTDRGNFFLHRSTC